jgi:hypothetical protein
MGSQFKQQANKTAMSALSVLSSQNKDHIKIGSGIDDETTRRRDIDDPASNRRRLFSQDVTAGYGGTRSKGLMEHTNATALAAQNAK